MDQKNRKPVKVSASAHAALAFKMRQWTGWGNKATLVLGETGTPSPYASCLHDPVYQITVNPETLLLNPNRVLNTVTPFRLRQEALLTGMILHEAGHARHSHWQPGRYGNPDKALHGDGFQTTHPLTGEAVNRPVSDLAMEFAKTLEEARVEGLIAGEATDIGAHGLAWTMRCSALKALPLTEVSLDEDQAVLEVMCSWILRAGRVIATTHHRLAKSTQPLPVPAWVKEFNDFFSKVVRDHIISLKSDPDDMPFDQPSADPELTSVMSLLYTALIAGPDEGADQPGSTVMVDLAQSILDVLFPPSSQDDLEVPPACPENNEEDTEKDEDSDEGEQEDSQEGQDEGESDDQDSDEGEDDEAGDEPGDAASDSESESGDDGEGDEQGEGGEGDTEPEDEGSGTEPGAGDSGSDDQPSDKPGNAEAQAALQQALSELEQKVSAAADTEAKAEVANPSEGPDPTEDKGESGETDTEATQSGDPSGASGGKGQGRQHLDYRHPKADDREVKRGASEFLRNIIDPSESGKMQVTDSPSSTVDGAALAAWKAGGQIATPLFFRRIKRTEQPAAPVKIAILVDVSASMDVLQEPSALLSWALSSAALDLRNFAGRGVQVESTLIHWGSNARVIQANGEAMPGIHINHCMESTSAMDDALDLVADQIPGFFDPAERAENRLLVQFTDWELAGWNLPGIAQRIDRALSVGVNMLSVVPMDYSWRRTKLDPILAGCTRPVGRTALLRYNPAKPHEVWSTAAEVLSGADTNHGF